MKNIAYWTTLLVVALSLAMFVYSRSVGVSNCPPRRTSINQNGADAYSAITLTNSSVSSLKNEALAKVVSSKQSKVSRILAPDSSFVVRGQLLYILDDSDIWRKIEAVNERLRREMQAADKYNAQNTGASQTHFSFANSKRTIQDLNQLRNELYRELSGTRIRAPFTGTLRVSKVKVGDTVYPGQLLNGISKHNTFETKPRTELVSEPRQCAGRRLFRI
jgi:multidrug resistance efflux pump